MQWMEVTACSKTFSAWKGSWTEEAIQHSMSLEWYVFYVPDLGGWMILRGVLFTFLEVGGWLRWGAPALHVRSNIKKGVSQKTVYRVCFASHTTPSSSVRLIRLKCLNVDYTVNSCGNNAQHLFYYILLIVQVINDFPSSKDTIRKIHPHHCWRQHRTTTGKIRQTEATIEGSLLGRPFGRSIES